MCRKAFRIASESAVGKKLEVLYEAYENAKGDRETKDDIIREAYHLLKRLINRVARNQSEWTGIPEDEYVSEMTLALWNAFKTYDESRGVFFSAWVTEVLSNAVYSVDNDYTAGCHGKYAETCSTAYEGNESEDGDDFVTNIRFDFTDNLPRASTNYFVESHFDRIPANVDIEAEVIDRLMRDYQRELICVLREKAPEYVRAYMAELIGEFAEHPLMSNDDQALSMTKIAMMFGIHHSKVSRGLKDLRYEFDPKKFGDLEDYLFRATEYPRLSEACASYKLPPERRRKRARKKNVEAKATKTTSKRGKSTRRARNKQPESVI